MLQKQTVSIPFTGGVDTKADAKLVIPGKLSRLENMLFVGGTLQKRPGTTLLSSLADGGPVQGQMYLAMPLLTASKQTNLAGEALFAFDSELVRVAAGAAYSYGPSYGRWAKRAGGAPTCTVSAKRLVRNTRTQNEFDQATYNNVTVAAWVESGTPSQGVHVAVFDEVTGAFYQTGTAALGTTTLACGMRAVAAGRYIHVYWQDVSIGSLYLAIVDTSTPETAPVPKVIRTDTAGNLLPCVDAVYYGGNVLVAYESTPPGGDVTLIAVSPKGAVQASPAPTTLTPAFTSPLSSVALAISSTGVGYILSSDGINGAWYVCFSAATLASSLSRTTISSQDYVRGTLYETSPGRMVAVISCTNTRIGVATLGPTGVVTPLANLPGTFSFALCSSVFNFNGTPAFAVFNQLRGSSPQTNLQPTGWVLDLSGNAIAKFLPGSCGTNAASAPRAGKAVAVSGGGVAFLAPEAGRLAYSSAYGGVVYNTTPIGITRITLQPATANQLPVNRLGDAVYMGGGLPRVYDGQQWVEQGFANFPEALAVTFGAGGGLSAGQYQWKAVYSWVNQRGELQRSQASPPVTGTATATQAATVTIPTCPMSGRDATGLGPVQIEVYRTTANGTLFYRVSSVASPTYNSTSANTVTFSDTITDANAQTGELLYTTGGIFDNFAVPAHKAACVHKDRLVVVGMEDTQTAWVSSKRVAGEMVRFSPNWVLRIPAAAGPITACASLDDKLVLFTAKGAFAVFGDGWDLLGNNPFSDPQPISSVNDGCVNPSSVASWPDGILYQGARGFIVLTRGLESQYVGADVEAYAGYTIRCVTLRPELEQVWVQADSGSDLTGAAYLMAPLETSSGGVCLVYDYHYGQWSVLPNYGAQDACQYQGKYTRVRSDGLVYTETPGAFLDSGAPYSSVVETAWLKLKGLQDFQRVYRASLVGTYGSDFTLTWDAAYNYAGPTTAPVYNAADTVSLSGVGVFSLGGPFQWRRHMRIQKCEAVKFRFSDSNIAGNGMGLALTDLTLEVGMKQGTFRLPATQST